MLPPETVRKTFLLVKKKAQGALMRGAGLGQVKAHGSQHTQNVSQEAQQLHPCASPLPCRGAVGHSPCVPPLPPQTKVMRVRAALTCSTLSSSYSWSAAWTWAGVKPLAKQRCRASA